ncbi:MAG: TIGR04282 family arsenosugar biosynthesis glycosyltransferase [Synechococcaceae cyanobacterium]|nr:TIGR04282 family arsenosugar biosynthesis glycosyltransferase [Synechococcaceae cyanobacterium]
MSRLPPAASPRQLVVMARWPAPGRCKSRLAAGTGRRRAAAVQERLTAHTLAAARGLGALAAADDYRPAPELVLAVDGLAAQAARRWGASLGAARVRRQGAGGLGVRLRRQLSAARGEGARAVVLVGSDLPALAAAELLEAFRTLERTPLVLGPARDGGYWLIGLAGAALLDPAGTAARLFAGHGEAIAWGSSRVLAQTLAAAEAAGLPWQLLGERDDLDRPDDLRTWR